MATWSDVRKIAPSFPGAGEGTAFGGAAWALGAKAPKGPILGVRTADLEMKDVLLACGQARGRGVFA